MRIDSLDIKHFKGFEEQTFQFHPEFNLIIGENGTGKTSLLQALSIAMGSWFLGLRGYDTRHIRHEEVMLKGFQQQAVSEDKEQHIGFNWEQQFPCVIEASGEVQGESLSWARSLNTVRSRTTYGNARNIKNLASRTDAEVRSGKGVLLPLISYYGTSRLWNVPREDAKVKGDAIIPGKNKLSRLEGYRNSVDPRISVPDLMKWIARQSWITFQHGGREPAIYSTVRDAMIACVEGAEDIRLDAEYGEVVVEGEQVRQPFNNLSDGMRSMLAMVGDIARKAAILNPHLGSNALTETPGVVLIDELDLHLHPRWQRHVIEDLRRTFPKIQFFAATHSPQIISEIQPESLLLLRNEGGRIVPYQCGQAYGLDSNYVLEFIMDARSRPLPASEAIEKVEKALEEGNLDDARRFLGDLRKLLHGEVPDVVRLEATINNLEALADAADTEEY